MWDKSSTALLLIDVQQGFNDPHWGRRNNPDAETNIATLLAAARKSGLPVIHVRHDSVNANSPLAPHKPGNAFMSFAEPASGEKVFGKTVNSAFIGTRLEEHLHHSRIANLMIAGFTAPHCISTSTRMAANLGFNVSVIEDATVAFELKAHDGKIIPPNRVHYQALAALSDEFAEIVRTQSILSFMTTL